MAAHDAAPRAGTQGNGNIIDGSQSIISQHDDVRADDFAALLPSRTPLPITTPAVLVARFQQMDERRRRLWRPCTGCGAPVESPAAIHESCAGWDALLAEIERIPRSIGARR
jgi:hypothetical protein